MKNRTVGFLIIAIALLIGFIIYSFNTALTEIVSTTCSHGDSCPMWGTIDFETRVSMSLMAFVVLVGLYFIFFAGESSQAEARVVSKEDYKKVLSKLGPDEKLVLEKVIGSEGMMYQSDLVKETGFNKVKVTRILDRLEQMRIIERRRRGMSNVVVVSAKVEGKR